MNKVQETEDLVAAAVHNEMKKQAVVMAVPMEIADLALTLEAVEVVQAKELQQKLSENLQELYTPGAVEEEKLD